MKTLVLSLLHAIHVSSVLSGLALLSVATMGSGCASVPMATPTDDARVKSAQPAPGMSLLYVYRNEAFGGAIKMPVLLDGQESGRTVAKTYVAWSVAPGPHQIMSKAENDSEIVVMAEPNKTHFVWQEVKMGVFRARSKLKAVSEDEGRRGLNECKLVQMTHPTAQVGSAPPAQPQYAAAPAPTPQYAPAPAPAPPPQYTAAPAPPAQQYAAAPAPQYAPASAQEHAAPAPQYATPGTQYPAPAPQYAAAEPQHPAAPATSQQYAQPYPSTAYAAPAYQPTSANTPQATISAVAPPQAAEGAELHDGFLLRLGMGGGYAAYASQDLRTKITGQSLSAQLAIGWAVVHNFALHIDSQIDMITSPSIDAASASQVDVDSALLQSVGAGATVFFGASNVFATASAVSARGIYTDSSGDVHESSRGIGLNLGLGKEWWVSDNWGMGGLLRLNTASFDDIEGNSYSTSVVSLALSMTYN